MCKEVDSDLSNTDNSVKVKTRDTKVLPATEAPVTIPENNKFLPPKHRVSNAKNDVKIDGNEVEDVSFSSLEASNNHDSQNLKNASNNYYSEYSTSNSESDTDGSNSTSGSGSTYSNDSE